MIDTPNDPTFSTYSEQQMNDLIPWYIHEFRNITEFYMINTEVPVANDVLLLKCEQKRYILSEMNILNTIFDSSYRINREETKEGIALYINKIKKQINRFNEVNMITTFSNYSIVLIIIVLIIITGIFYIPYFAHQAKLHSKDNSTVNATTISITSTNGTESYYRIYQTENNTINNVTNETMNSTVNESILEDRKSVEEYFTKYILPDYRIYFNLVS